MSHDEPLRLVVVSAGVSEPSSSRLLADWAAQKALDLLRESGESATASAIELGPLAADTAQAIVSGFPGERLQAAFERLAAADAVIATTPVYKAGISGLFKSFADMLDNDLLIAKPVILAATAGTSRHAMVVDEQLRPLFAFLRALPVPTSLFAAPEDWGIPHSATGSNAPPPNSWCCCAAASAAPSPTVPGPLTATGSAATPRAPNEASRTWTSAPI
ncbi:CE1759 family FMN reductase [Streptomyces sp. NPDC048411]|uniref:CE1759 family FMN reductase n=1 Tax=Streptomyces sp. NPDC048411 TaxID=3157206 RepID=UPI0034532B4A